MAKKRPRGRPRKEQPAQAVAYIRMDKQTHEGYKRWARRHRLTIAEAYALLIEKGRVVADIEEGTAHGGWC